MSRDGHAGGSSGGRVDWSRERLLALGGIALLTATYVSVLYHVTDVVGDGTSILVLVAGTLALATLVGRYVRLGVALTVTVAIVAGGAAVYVLSIPESQRALLTVDRVVADSLALLTGLSILRLTGAGVWALAVAPAPVFLSWYLAVRSRYAWSVAVGGLGLGLVALTGDADAIRTLLGVVGAVVALGAGSGAVRSAAAGTAGRRGDDAAIDTARRAQLETLATVLAGIVLVSGTRSVIPGSAAGPLVPDRSSETVESSLVDAQDSVTVLGSIRLSSKVRFTVDADEGEYWQTAAYDRYTGSGWVRTGDTEPYEGRLSDPPGGARTLQQRVTAKAALGTLPAAWKPVSLDGAAAEVALQTPQGGIRPRASIAAGSTYGVTSRIPQYTSEQLRRAGTDYPESVAVAYRQLPDSTPARVRQRAQEVTADAENAYEAAEAVATHLEAEKRYSLTVDESDGDTADAFLFEMDAGYCVYFATTMIVMLRSVGVPARFVVGYTAGERADGEYVVRGLDSHAWVQVYFPDVGWVRFDPTPAGPRREAETARLAEARESGEEGVDVPETEPTTDNESTTPTPETPTTTTTTTPDGDQPTTPGAGLDPGATTDADEGLSLPELPDRETLALWLVAMVGAVAGARRTGLTARGYRALWLRRQPTTDDPEQDVRRAFARLERLLSRDRRPRRPGETPRAYVSAVIADERSQRVLAAYEAARYGDGVDRATADAAVEAVDDLVAERTWPGRLRR